MSPPGGNGPPDKRSFPRVSGDEPENVEGLTCLLPFSPRERG